MAEGYIQRATRLLKRRRFREVVRLLEPQVFQYRQNLQFYYLLGVSSLYAGDVRGAESYLSRAHQINESHVDVLLGLAAVDFRKGELEESLAKWLQVLEHEPDNRIAKRGLEVLRSDPRVQAYRTRTGLASRLYPPLPSQRHVGRVVLAVTLVMAVAAAIPVLIRSTREEREGLEEARLPGGEDSLIAPEGTYRYELSEREVKAVFTKIRRLFNERRDNLCLVEINRLLLSNASRAVKETAAMLRDYIERPNFSTIKDSFSYSEVRAEPYLYQGCYVVWTGKIANLEIGTEVIRFDLLVGYQEEKELEGIVPVSLDFGAALTNGNNLEILGQVALNDGGIYLYGLSIHKIANRPDGPRGSFDDDALARAAAHV